MLMGHHFPAWAPKASSSQKLWGGVVACGKTWFTFPFPFFFLSARQQSVWAFLPTLQMYLPFTTELYPASQTHLRDCDFGWREEKKG